MITAAFVLLAVAVVGFSFRLVRGPSLADRIIAIDGLLGLLRARAVGQLDLVRIGLLDLERLHIGLSGRSDPVCREVMCYRPRDLPIFSMEGRILSGETDLEELPQVRARFLRSTRVRAPLIHARVPGAETEG